MRLASWYDPIIFRVLYDHQLRLVVKNLLYYRVFLLNIQTVVGLGISEPSTVRWPISGMGYLIGGPPVDSGTPQGGVRRICQGLMLQGLLEANPASLKLTGLRHVKMDRKGRRSWTPFRSDGLFRRVWLFSCLYTKQEMEETNKSKYIAYISRCQVFYQKY